jgi:hypothetical protein
MSDNINGKFAVKVWGREGPRLCGSPPVPMKKKLLNLFGKSA